MLSYSQDRVWLKGLFQKYYQHHFITPDFDVSRREFGWGILKKIDTRHVSFATNEEVNNFLRNASPLYLSFSVSHYQNPGNQPISSKGWLGSDLVYEFDADDIPTECKAEHDSWSCSHCGASGKGRVLKCTSCGHGTSVNEWVCEKCLDETKKQTFQLIQWLQDDFGIVENEILVNFSGGKGYHIHVRSPSFFGLSKTARTELMDYLSMHEFDLEMHGFSFDGKLFHSPTYAKAKGHAKRIVEELLRLMENGTLEEWVLASGSSPRTLKSFLGYREEWFKDMMNGVLPPLPGKKTEAFWKGVLTSITEKLRSRFDRQTSGDMYKIVRVPNTLHGSTGLLAKSVPLTELKEFDPFSHACVFSLENERKLLVRSTPKIRVGSFSLEKTQEAEVTVPEAVAVYLVGNAAAEIR